MKRILLSLVCLLLFSGCGRESALDESLRLRDNLLKADGCAFDAAMTADYGDVTYTFEMKCKSDSAGNITFSVLKPDTIKGITGTIESEGGKLTFDDKILAFDVFADGLISPVSGPWYFIRALSGGYIRACEQSDDGFHMVVNDTYLENAFQVDIFTDNNLQPIHGEIFWKGYRILTLSLSNFKFL